MSNAILPNKPIRLSDAEYLEHGGLYDFVCAERDYYKAIAERAIDHISEMELRIAVAVKILGYLQSIGAKQAEAALTIPYTDFDEWLSNHPGYKP